MALKAYTLDLALQTSSEFAIGNTIPNIAGIATDGKGFIPTKNSINKTITLSKGFGKFGGRLFELTEQTVYSWDAGSTDADAYLVIDLTKQNSFTGTIEDGTYTFVDNQSSIVVSSTQPEPSANTLVYKLDGNYNTMTGGLKGGQVNLPTSGDLNTLTDTGKYYLTTSVNAANWSNRPSNAPNLAFSVDVIGQANRSLATQVFYVHTTSRMWVRTMWLVGTTITTSPWVELANNGNVVHTTDNETIDGDKTFTGKVNVSGVVSSSKNYIEFDKPISTPVISGTVTMWYGWKVYYHVENGMVTYQFQTTGSTIPSGTISNEKLPKAAIPLYKTFVPLAYGGQGFAINIDGSLENYTGVSISGASWASASSHVLNKW